MLTNWEQLDDRLKNDEVKKYYNILSHRKGSLLLKRIFDIVVSLLMIVLLSPVLLCIAIWIKVDSKGPVFYRQVRVTKNNKDFRIFKFRTMVQDADKIGSLVTVGNDSRITKVGAKIRKIRLDELPQLFNIVTGDMSFVGTRPEVRKYVDRYTDEMMATLLLPAGVTGSGMSVDDAYIECVLPDKMKYNIEALEKFSFLAEIKLMFKTAVEVIR